MDAFYTDPTARFASIVAASGRRGRDAGAPPLPVEQWLRDAQGGGRPPDDVASQVAQEVAGVTALTAPQAKQLVSVALDVTGHDPAAAGRIVNTAVANAIAGAGSISLSDPVPLGWFPRLVTALLLGTVTILSTVFVYRLSSTSHGWAPYVAFMIATVLTITGTLVLIMGYRTVNISVTGNTGGSSGI